LPQEEDALEKLELLGYIIAITIYIGTASLFYGIIGIILYGARGYRWPLFIAVMIPFWCFVSIVLCVAIAMTLGAEAIPLPGWFAQGGK